MTSLAKSEGTKEKMNVIVQAEILILTILIFMRVRGNQAFNLEHRSKSILKLNCELILQIKSSLVLYFDLSQRKIS